MSEDTSRAMSPRQTEQIKLTATYINGLAVAIFAVGGFAPLFSGGHPDPGDPNFLYFLGITVACWLASGGLHYVALRVLERLPDDEPTDL